LPAACASTETFDGFEDAHSACFAYIYGDDRVRIDYRKARKWCAEGDREGNAKSTTLLAETYLYGLATPVDIDTALAFYDKAAEAGHIHAQLMVYILNNEYLADESTPEQKWRGLAFLQQSAAAGYEKAQKS
jgi:TPR repeat protein